MIAVGIIENGSSIAASFTNPKMCIQGLHIGSLIYTKPLFSNSCPNFPSLAYSGH